MSHRNSDATVVITAHRAFMRALQLLAMTAAQRADGNRLIHLRAERS